ncbi:MAG: SAM-dependent methyltransferase [Oscillospiraceae bacterium]|nr:SAM-dependent methyltransferase [Oscillospiraceae bacterium]
MSATGKQLELPPRLRRLADWTPQGAAFVDVGTDHALLPVWLTLNGRVRRCVASDLRPEPLRRARANAKLWNASGIRFRLCDGLSGVHPDEADTIAIAGLGGENIAAILQKAPWTRDKSRVLLLQPMTRAETLRGFLAENGYAIRREAIVKERGVLYPIMEAVGGEMSLTPGQRYGGAKLLRDPLGDRYLIETILRLQNALAGLNRGLRNGNADAGRADELREILTELFEMREAWRYANRPGD